MTRARAHAPAAAARAPRASCVSCPCCRRARAPRQCPLVLAPRAWLVRPGLAGDGPQVRHGRGDQDEQVEEAVCAAGAPRVLLSPAPRALPHPNWSTSPARTARASLLPCTRLPFQPRPRLPPPRAPPPPAPRLTIARPPACAFPPRTHIRHPCASHPRTPRAPHARPARAPSCRRRAPRWSCRAPSAISRFFC
jgi:hypothetical protein